MGKTFTYKINRGKIINLELPASSLNAASEQLPEGVYTTLRTFEGGHFLALDDHIHRLEESARLLGRAENINPASLFAALRSSVQQSGFAEARIRITLDLAHEPGALYVTLEPLNLPSKYDYAHGVAVITYPYQRDNPKAKQTAFIYTVESIRQRMPDGINEGLMVNEAGNILEGLTSNFFAVKDKVLYTAEKGVLDGITRSMVLEAARQEAIPLRFEAVNLSELPDLEEAFLTSSSRSILPIRQVDGMIIGNGEPGPVTKRLSEKYIEEIRKKLS